MSTPGKNIQVDVVRRPEQADDSCRLVPGDSESIYSGICVRIYPIDNDLTVLQSYGLESKDMVGATSCFAGRIRDCDFVLVPWGSPTNLDGPVDLPCGFYPQVAITTPEGSATLTWSGGQYFGGGYYLYFDIDHWILDTPTTSVAFSTDITESMDITVQEWPDGYTAQRTGPAVEYVVKRVWHHSDLCGKYHHTQMWLKEVCNSTLENWKAGLND